jgi:hypothetical protein
MLPWITYHAQIGVSKIYVLYDGTDRNTHTVGACSLPPIPAVGSQRQRMVFGSCGFSHGKCCTARWILRCAQP